MPIISMAGVFMMILVIVSAGRDNLLNIGPLLFIASMVHHSTGYLLDGGKSHFESPLLWNWLKDNIKGVRLEIIKEGGHGYYESHPDIFNQLVLDFLTK
jgi:pimeloyl-ACP methyl ester carboxylesterase